jgi:hypothetical protein
MSWSFLSASSWQNEFLIQARFLTYLPVVTQFKLFFCHSPGFVVKVKTILESICMNYGKLKADAVIRFSSPITRAAFHQSNFWGLSPVPWRTLNPHLVSTLDNRGRSSTCRGRPHYACFRSLDRRVDLIAAAQFRLNMRLCGGLNKECEKGHPIRGP